VADSAAYASGLLIGHDVAGVGLPAGATVGVLADPHLGGLYAAAIAIAGGKALPVDSHAAFAAGIHRIWKASKP
jgi:2-dehydro-3-deoxygalactonokinase